MTKEKIIDIIIGIQMSKDTDYITEALNKIITFIINQKEFNYQKIIEYIRSCESGKLGGRFMYINKAYEYLVLELKKENKKCQ